MKKINIIGFGKMGMQISSLLIIMGYKVNIFTKNFSLKKKNLIFQIRFLRNFLKLNNQEVLKFMKILRDLPKNHTIETLLEDLTIKKTYTL
jgi:3-hydroxyacyl-CoA dehydrogenase